MGNTVLILGNGFDLAHGLSTKYSDFLNFCKIIYKIKNYEYNNMEWTDFQTIEYQIEKYTGFKKILLSYFKNKLKVFRPNYSKYIKDIDIDFDLKTIDIQIDKICELIKDNVWYNYFSMLYNNNTLKGQNWIDFESEISHIIEIIDRFTNDDITKSFNEVSKSIDLAFNKDDFKIRQFCKPLVNTGSVRDLREKLHFDLERIVRALEIYLSYFVSNVEIPIISNDISDIKPNYIINFNYTDTYQRIYTHKRIYGNSTEAFHIHGYCDYKRAFEENNMVLGIDEYWPKNERDSHTNFTIFKKFAQRIQKRTGIESYKWIEKIKKEYKECNTVSKVYVFGHSLDVTDKDILFDYLNDDATDVTIFCYDKETEGEYIANVIKIIGEERLLEKVYQDPPKLRFVIQQDMIPIKKDEKELATVDSAT